VLLANDARAQQSASSKETKQQETKQRGDHHAGNTKLHGLEGGPVIITSIGGTPK
jgi:hypothetical protein